jgi:hydrogenase expression/formation protein HypC
MCLGIPARVISVGTDHPDLASVDMAGLPRTVNIGLLDEAVSTGEWLLVHMGFALSTMTAQEAAAALSVFTDEREAEAAQYEQVHDRPGG